MAQTNKSCAACHALQRDLEREAQLAPRTLHCFAGLCETAVPVRVGENLVAFLSTGQVFLHRPTKSQFNRVASHLLKWGSEVDLKSFEEAYFNTRVLEEDHYPACIRLLEIFAKHLEDCASRLIQTHSNTEPASVSRARVFIGEHADDELSLVRIAKAVNVSANYFSTLFKQATGLNFADYLARVRNRENQESAAESQSQDLRDRIRTWASSPYPSSTDLSGASPVFHRKNTGIQTL
jgi:AraC-like DNA-binding protein